MAEEQRQGWVSRTLQGTITNSALSAATYFGLKAAAASLEKQGNLQLGDVVEFLASAAPWVYTTLLGPNRCGGGVKTLYRFLAGTFLADIAFLDTLNLLDTGYDLTGLKGKSLYSGAEGLVDNLQGVPGLGGATQGLFSGRNMLFGGLSAVIGAIIDGTNLDWYKKRRDEHII